MPITETIVLIWLAWERSLTGEQEMRVSDIRDVTGLSSVPSVRSNLNAMWRFGLVNVVPASMGGRASHIRYVRTERDGPDTPKHVQTLIDDIYEMKGVYQRLGTRKERDTHG